MVTIMDTGITTTLRTESISACTTVGTVVISVAHTTVAHTTALPASQVITTVLAESAPVAVATSVVVVPITEAWTTVPTTEVSTIVPISEVQTVVLTGEAVAATSTVIAQGASHATKAM